MENEKTKNASQRKYRFPTKCSVCARECQYYYYSVASCDGCKHFFRRTVILKKNLICKREGKCEIIKGAKCKSCRFDKCILAGMNARTVRMDNPESTKQMLECFEERRKKLNFPIFSADNQIMVEASKENSGNEHFDGAIVILPAKTIEVEKPFSNQNVSAETQTLNYFLYVEKYVHKIRSSPTPVPERHYEPASCSSLVNLLLRRENLIAEHDLFETGRRPLPLPQNIVEMIRKYGAFTRRPPYLALDLLLVVEIAKTMPFFARLALQDQWLLISTVAMPLVVLSNAYYSYRQQRAKTVVMPAGSAPIVLFTGEKYKDDKNVDYLTNKVFTEVMEPFHRVQPSDEEFVLLRAIIYSHMVTNGLSPNAQQILVEEAQKYSKMLLQTLQKRHGDLGGARKYAELLQLVEYCFNGAHHHIQFLNYMVNVHERIQFDAIMPSALAQLCIGRNVELPELLPI